MMKGKKVKIIYEPSPDVLSWEAGRGSIDYTEELGNMVVHFTKNKSPVLVEMLEASRFLSKTQSLVGKIITPPNPGSSPGQAFSQIKGRREGATGLLRLLPRNDTDRNDGIASPSTWFDKTHHNGSTKLTTSRSGSQ